ncbi:hypothetical protein Bca52824_042733 [Brassica carinata]|uniref:Aconitase A/isopropylmalate dehydratase small subunit swivel domain-containing protein n=1 Tax=Brassica carinata TaxID=52824 RepID=A0A8X7S261_BRACI|nr:hypothetical protein Bca52824_042733 [Brassica carinata]
MAASSLQSLNPTFSQTLASPNTFPSFRSPFLRFNSSFNLKPLTTRSSSFIARSAAEPQERKTFHGLCYVVGDNIDTDQIIPAEFLTLVPSNPDEYEKLGSYALIGLPGSYKDRFNFGCGSSREHAPVCLGAAGAKAVVAQSYARIFFRNSVATGEVYPLDSEVRVCDECKTGIVLINHTTGKEYKLKPIGDAGPVIDAGGIFAYARKAGMIPSAAAA